MKLGMALLETCKSGIQSKVSQKRLYEEPILETRPGTTTYAVLLHNPVLNRAPGLKWKVFDKIHSHIQTHAF
jgi:hypothetical protein